MKSLDEYIEMWEADSIVDMTRIDEESIKVIPLHSKYMKCLSPERRKLKRLVESRKKLEKKLEGYYNGSIDGKDIGREPNQEIIRTEAAIRRRVESDDEMIKWNLAIIEQDEKVSFLVEVVKEVSKRSFNFRNFIEYTKYIKGFD
jgi:hypothetical protein